MIIASCTETTEPADDAEATSSTKSSVHLSSAALPFSTWYLTNWQLPKRIASSSDIVSRSRSVISCPAALASAAFPGPKGTGSISVRPDGKADAEIKIKEWDGTETRHRKRLPSREAAERWLVRVRYEHERNMLPSAQSERLTLGEYLTSWLESIEGTVSRHTYRDYQDKVRLHINPILGENAPQGPHPRTPPDALCEEAW